METIKCLESPYYFITNYMDFTDSNENIIKFTTKLSELEFNKIIKNEL